MTRKCVVCGQDREVHCTEEQYQRWRNGALIQYAMPDVPAEEREMLLTGICGDCYEHMFSSDAQ